jgi:phasin protein
MPDGSAPQAGAQNLLTIPAVALGMWGPWLIGAAKLSGQIQQGFGTLASEWQNFVGRRVKEDFTFVQRLMASRRSDQIWQAHAEFWEKAMEDYTREYLLMGRLAAGVTNKAVSAAQCATMDASKDMLPFLRAA